MMKRKFAASLTFTTTLILVSMLFAQLGFTKENISSRDYNILEKAYQALEKEQYSKCIEKLRPLLDEDKPPSYTFSYASICYNNSGKLSLAVKSLERAVSLYPKKGSFFYDLAILQMQQSSYSKAIKSLEKAIVLSKTESLPKSINYHIAFAHYQLEQYKKAERKISKLNRSGTPPRHWLQLEAYCQIALEKWPKAEKTCKRILWLDANDASTWQLLGQIALNKSDYNSAAAYLEITKIISPSSAPSKTLANLYQAKSAWNEQYRNSKKDSYGEAKILLKANRYNDSSELIPRPTKDMETAYLLAKLLFYEGKNKEAIKELKRIDKLPILYLGSSANISNKKKRRIKGNLIKQSYLLLGQILWLEHEWLQARDVFKKLELEAGQAEIGKSLAYCMQTLLDEKNKHITMPTLNDPAIVIEQ